MDIPGAWNDIHNQNATASFNSFIDASQGVAPMSVDGLNVWADITTDSNSHDEAVNTASLMQMDSSGPETSVATMKGHLEPKCDTNSDSQSSKKRKASTTASIKQRSINGIRETIAASRRSAVRRGVDMHRMNAERNMWRKQHKKDINRREQDQEHEAEMADSILQYEREVDVLKGENNCMTHALQDALQQFDELMRKLNEIQSDNQRERATWESEITNLRQRLQAAQHSVSTRHAPSESSSHDQATPISRGGRYSIGVVPLRPVVPPPNARSNQVDEITDQDMLPDLSTPQGIKTIQNVVKEVINQLNADIGTTGRARARQSTRTRNRLSIENKRRKIGRAKDLAWKEAVRVAWKAAFDVTSIDEFSLYNPAPTSAVQDYETGQNGPDEQNILDFGKGFDRSRWNKTILDRVCTDFLENCQAEGNRDTSEVSREYVIALFQGQLKRSRDAWRLVQRRPNHDASSMETIGEVSERLEIHSRERLAAVASRSRCERKLERRMSAVEKTILIKSRSNAPDLDTWKYFASLLKKLSVDGMSSEEEGVARVENVQVSIFRVKLCVWRNPAIRDYLKYIDRESQNPAIRPAHGGKLQPRIHTDEPGVTAPPKNLPECLFNEDWLADQRNMRGDEWIEKELMVSREVFEILEFVAHMHD